MQEGVPKRLEPARNPETTARFRKEVLWQITVPFILGVLIVVGGAVLLGYLGVGDTAVWSDISTMWLLLPVFILGIIPLALSVGLIFLLTRALSILPAYAYQVQLVFARVRDVIRRGADRAVEPVLRLHSSSASVRSLRRTVKRSRYGDK